MKTSRQLLRPALLLATGLTLLAAGAASGLTYRPVVRGVPTCRAPAIAYRGSAPVRVVDPAAFRPAPVYRAPGLAPRPVAIAPVAPAPVVAHAPEPVKASELRPVEVARPEEPKPVEIAKPAVAEAAKPVPEGLERHRSLVKSQEERVDALFGTTGFASREAFETSVRAQGHGEVLDFLGNEKNWQFVMNKPEIRRDGIAAKGFLNQFETGTSEGRLSPQLRNHAESVLMGVPEATYAAFDPAMKPRYGYLRTAPDASAKMGPPSRSYGPDTYVFKAEKVRDFLTYTDGDSLGYCYVGCGGFNGKWDHSFLPWKDRELLAGSLSVGAGTVTRTPLIQLPGMQSSMVHGRDYVELQYWKPLNLDDVESFEFSGQAPSGQFLKDLQDHGVKIFHRLSTGQAEEWTPPVAAAPVEPVRSAA